MPQPHVVVVEGNPRGYRSPAHLRLRAQPLFADKYEDVPNAVEVR
jgi:hypothetical protein